MALASREIFGTFNVRPFLVATERDEFGASQSVNGPSDRFFGGDTYFIDVDVTDLTGDTFTLRGDFEIFTGDNPFDTLDNSQIQSGSILGLNPATGIVVDNPEDGAFEITYPVSFLQNSIGNSDIIQVIDTGNQTDDTEDIVILSFSCFAEGTAIATPVADVPIEDLKVGDLVCTADGRDVAVRWVGYQTISTRFGPAERLLPVRIRKGALSLEQPSRDLVITADHGVVIDGFLINAGALVGSADIDWVPLSELGQSFRVFHLETDNHEVVFAEGVTVETFIDYEGRQCFDNFAEYSELYGHGRVIPEMDLPRISTQRLVPATVADRLGLSCNERISMSERCA